MKKIGVCCKWFLLLSFICCQVGRVSCKHILCQEEDGMPEACDFSYSEMKASDQKSLQSACIDSVLIMQPDVSCSRMERKTFTKQGHILCELGAKGKKTSTRRSSVHLLLIDITNYLLYERFCPLLVLEQRWRTHGFQILQLSHN